MQAVPLLLSMAALVLAACGDGPGPLPPPPPPPALCSPAFDLTEGERLFDHETFGGNGRTCVSCHTRENGTITLEAVAQRLAANPDDELFRHDGLDDGLAGTSRIATHATIRVELELPAYVTLAANPAQRTIVVHRGVPTTMNTPALDGHRLSALMLDLRDPDLQQQALGAIRNHAQSTVEPTRPQLDAIATFQQCHARFFSSAALRAFAEGGTRSELPQGNTESEKRGRTFFVDSPLRPGSKEGICAACHSGPMLNEVNQFGAAEIPEVRAGAKFGTVRVAENNALRNPMLSFLVDGPGGARMVFIADPGIMLTDRSRSPHLNAFAEPGLHPARLAGFFKTPSLWGVRHTAPYFHDNSAKTLREVIDHYADVFFPEVDPLLNLTEQDLLDMLAFLELL